MHCSKSFSLQAENNFGHYRHYISSVRKSPPSSSQGCRICHVTERARITSGVLRIGKVATMSACKHQNNSHKKLCLAFPQLSRQLFRVFCAFVCVCVCRYYKLRLRTQHCVSVSYVFAEMTIKFRRRSAAI